MPKKRSPSLSVAGCGGGREPFSPRSHEHILFVVVVFLSFFAERAYFFTPSGGKGTIPPRPFFILTSLFSAVDKASSPKKALSDSGRRPRISKLHSRGKEGRKEGAH